jgi:hypothetical protein
MSNSHFWRSTLLDSDSREMHSVHEAAHAVMAVLCDTYVYAIVYDKPLEDGTNGVCQMFGNLSYEDDLDVTLAGPEAEFLVSGDRLCAAGDNEDIEKLTTGRYKRLYSRGKVSHGVRFNRREMIVRDLMNSYDRVDATLTKYRTEIEEVAYRILVTGWASHIDVCDALGVDPEWDDNETQSM